MSKLNLKDNEWQFLEFKSRPPNSPFAPVYHYIFAENYIDEVDFKKIACIILEKEQQIINSTMSTSDAHTGLGNNSLTSRWKSFNVFAWADPEIGKLKAQVRRRYLEFLNEYNVPRSKVKIQCWANVLRRGQEIAPHIHSTGPWTYLGGHVCVQCDNTSTIYINPINQIDDQELYISYNLEGKITMFQQNIPHYTTMYNGSTERITIAFDIYLENFVNSFDCIKYPEWNNLIVFDDPAGTDNTQGLNKLYSG